MKELDDTAPGKWSYPDWSRGAKRKQEGSKGYLAAAANGQVQGGKASAAKARARRVAVTLPAISIQKRDG